MNQIMNVKKDGTVVGDVVLTLGSHIVNGEA